MCKQRSIWKTTAQWPPRKEVTSGNTKGNGIDEREEETQ